MNEFELQQFIDYVHEATNDSLIESLGLLEKANKIGFVCPECRNGTGEDGDGIVLIPGNDRNKKGRYHCFKCSKNYDLIDLVQKRYNLSRGESIRKTAEILNYHLPGNDMNNQKKSGNVITTPTHTEKTINNNITHTEKNPINHARRLPEALTAESGTYKELIDRAKAILSNSPSGIEYLKGRGISGETASYFNMGMLTNLNIGGFLFKEVIVIPGSYEGYGVRNIDPDAGDNYRYRKVSGGLDVPVGLKQVIHNPDKRNPITGYVEPVFICEGFIDAPSFHEVGADAISLNGIGNAKEIIESFKYFEINRPIILALDNDETGRKQQESIFREIMDAGLEVYPANEIYGKYKDANEFLVSDREKFRETVTQYRIVPVKEFNKTFNAGQLESFKNHIKKNANTPGIPTGFETLDSKKFLDGGLYPGLYVIGALSSLGKTAFILQIADNIAKSGTDVLYISLEMPAHELRARSISRYTLKKSMFNPDNAKTLRQIIDGKRYQNYSNYELNLINQSIESYFEDTGKHLRIIEGLGDINAEDITEMVRKHTHYRGTPPVVFIDYLQLLIQPRDKKFSMTDKQIVDSNIFQLKHLSRDYNIPVVGISSFNRENYNNSVSMSSFKESGAIEYSSDVLIGLERVNASSGNGKNKLAIELDKQKQEDKEYKTGIKDLRLVILKNRNGTRGGKDIFKFDAPYNYFREVGDERELEEFDGITLRRD